MAPTGSYMAPSYPTVAAGRLNALPAVKNGFYRALLITSSINNLAECRL